MKVLREENNTTSISILYIIKEQFFTGVNLIRDQQMSNFDW